MTQPLYTCQKAEEKNKRGGKHTEGGQKQQAIVETALDVKLGSHLCELQKVALRCFLEPDTCEGENSLLSTCGELSAPSRALNLKPFKPRIGQRAFLEHLLSVRKMHF